MKTIIFGCFITQHSMAAGNNIDAYHLRLDVGSLVLKFQSRKDILL